MSETSTIAKPTAPSTAPVKTNLLNATHRCDKCSAAAFVKVTLKVSGNLPDGGELMFCNHHYNKVEMALLPFTEAVLDERHKLVQNKLVGNENS